jgi:hypothetical protein
VLCGAMIPNCLFRFEVQTCDWWSFFSILISYRIERKINVEKNEKERKKSGKENRKRKK